MRGNKRTFPNFHLSFMIPMNSNFFQTQNPREKMTWLLPFKMKRVLKIFEFHLKYFQIWKLYATQWFSWEKIKWLLQNIWNMSWKFKRVKFKVPFELFSIWSYFGFFKIIFSPKLKYMEIMVKWFPTIENWIKINLKAFWYF